MKNLVTILIVLTSLMPYKTIGQNRRTESLLMNYIWKGEIGNVKRLINAGASVNGHSKNLCFPIIYAVLSNNLELADLLLKNGAKSDTCPDSHPLLMCLLRQEPNMEYDGNQTRYAPFYYALKLGKLEMVKKFCEYGTDVTKKIGGINYTYPIIAATKSGNEELINFLLEKGVDITVLASNGESAYSQACLHNNRDLAFYMLEHGVNIVESDFETNARMYHLSGDYYLAKGDINTSKTYYLKAKQYYNATISIEKGYISDVNVRKALDVIGGVAVSTTTNLMQTNQMQRWQNLGFSKSNAYLMTMPYAENLRKIYSPVFKDNEILLYDYQLPAGASLDEQKVFYKNKINQFEMSIKLIDSVLTCMEKGILGEELNFCIQGIELSDKSKK
jgi:ankyrin repeat protein